MENGVESVWINPLQIDSPNFDGQILLERPKKIEENDMKPKEDIQVPFISMEPEIITDSPDPEYEDTADLATSIAKLRSLLQQRSSESSVSTPAVSPIFIDDEYGIKKSPATYKITFFNARPPEEFPQRLAEAENISDIDEGDGVMPSFYKFCAKTATGVFDKTINTIKTALPSNIQGIGQLDNAWIFVQTDQTEAEILTRMKKLLTERKEYCTLDTDIDTAYEAIDSLETYRTNASGFPPNVEFEDELDDFEVKLPITKALVDIMCELLADTNSPFLQEPLVKAILLSFGTSIQNIVISKIDGYMECLLTDLITIPETSNYNTLSLEMDAYVEALLNGLPDVVNVTFGKPALTKALTLLITSLQIWNINQDIALQIFELISMKLIEERTQISPPASA
ncbi:hypothetical protein NQ317_012192 [Molorchus minor]|uniref:Uncharacterized protein n=1 Tax=Molorchus minor TaxID=1323400 RepID=A0ABQ9K4G0_9CUCU|nr:hypothetical protein NQ317_012192 [Molorchus minor]